MMQIFKTMVYYLVGISFVFLATSCQYYEATKAKNQIKSTMEKISIDSDREDAVRIITPLSEEHRICWSQDKLTVRDVFVVKNTDGYMVTTNSQKREDKFFVISIGTLESEYKNSFIDCDLDK